MVVTKTTFEEEKIKRKKFSFFHFKDFIFDKYICKMYKL